MKTDRDSRPHSELPEDLRGRCRQIAREIRDRSEEVRDDKILSARVRICSGYYDSEGVLRTIADRLLSEGRARPSN